MGRPRPYGCRSASRREIRPDRGRPSWMLVTAVLLLAGLLHAVPAVAEEEGGASEAPALDQVHLRNGSLFEGRIESQDAEAVVLRLVSDAGGEGRMRFPMTMVSRIVRGRDRGPLPGSGHVHDAYFLLRSGGQTVGTRHLRLRYVRSGESTGWRLEEHITHFARGKRVPATHFHRMETTDLQLLPRQLNYREVGEASGEPGGFDRYEKILTGPVKDGIWTALVRIGGDGRQRQVPAPAGVRARLGTREHLIRRREVGLQEVKYLDTARPGLVQVRAGYSALGARDEGGAPYDEFVWEEDGVRLVSRFREAKVVEEQVAEGVTAVPATQVQAEAAAEEADRPRRRQQDDRKVQLPAVGVTFRLPGDTWTASRAEVSATATGWRKVAMLESRFLTADVRVEWDPEGAVMAPGAADASERLLQRLRAVCPDLEVVVQRTPLRSDLAEDRAWRMTVRGTLKSERGVDGLVRGEKIRTVVVVVDRGQGRILFLAACPEVAWNDVSASFERLVESIEVM